MSTHDELTTVNDELRDRNREMLRVNSDLVNVLDTVDFPILIVDLERRLRRFTPRARTVLNVRPGDVGRAFGDLDTDLDMRDLDAQLAAVIETGVAREAEVQDHHGHWYRMTIRPYRTLPDDRVDGAVLSLVDIDALKHHVGEAQRAHAEAERANRSKDDFLATLSHELRSPLSSVLLHAQLLRDGGLDDAKVRRAGEAIERNTRMQMRLIEDLLDVSRIVAGKIKLDRLRVNLAAVVEAALDGVRAGAARKSIAVGVVLAGAPPLVIGDATRLHQVVTNLLGNALKFTPAGGQVTVTLATADGQARLAVTDTGVGIEAAFLPQVFHRFTQEDTSVRRQSGLGLGLAIVRHLVELHGGAVRAESPGKGRGATFVVTLPLAAAAAATLPAAEPVRRPAAVDPRQLAGLRLLLVDDDPGSRDALAELLTRRGAEVSVAASADEALAAVAARRPDLLVCDVAMSDEDGSGFIRRLRALPSAGGGEVPALALTGFAAEDDRRRALAAGFQLHLTKPFDVDRLVDCILALRVSGGPRRADALYSQDRDAGQDPARRR